MPESRAQVRWAHAAASGSAPGDATFAREVISKMHGRKMSSLSERKGKKKSRLKIGMKEMQGY